MQVMKANAAIFVISSRPFLDVVCRLVGAAWAIEEMEAGGFLSPGFVIVYTPLRHLEHALQ